jgi:hypothetical protein
VLKDKWVFDDTLGRYEAGIEDSLQNLAHQIGETRLQPRRTVQNTD